MSSEFRVPETVCEYFFPSGNCQVLIVYLGQIVRIIVVDVIEGVLFDRPVALRFVAIVDRLLVNHIHRIKKLVSRIDRIKKLVSLFDSFPIVVHHGNFEKEIPLLLDLVMSWVKFGIVMNQVVSESWFLKPSVLCFYRFTATFLIIRYGGKMDESVMVNCCKKVIPFPRLHNFGNL